MFAQPANSGSAQPMMDGDEEFGVASWGVWRVWRVWGSGIQKAK